MIQLLSLKFYLFLLMMYLFIISCNTPDIKTTDIISTINYDYSGCFGSGKSKIIIYKVDNSIMAKLENDSGKLIVNTKLSNLQLDTFNLFISDLRHLGENGLCTTVCHYSVVIKNESIKRTDNSCNWNGFRKLSNCLFKNAYYPVMEQ